MRYRAKPLVVDVARSGKNYWSVTYPDGGIETISDEDLQDRYDRLPDVAAGRSWLQRFADWFCTGERMPGFPPPKRK